MSSLKIKDLGEFGLIDYIRSINKRKDYNVSIPIGDDASLIENIKNGQILVTTDLLVEGIDFKLDYFNPSELAYKTIAVNISDISAMGGLPAWFTISIGFPENTGLDFLEKFFEELISWGEKNNISLVGGDISKAPKITISITLLGTVTDGKVIKRNGAKPGQSVWITGGVGFSFLGLEFLLKNSCKKSIDGVEKDFVNYCVNLHKKPPIRTSIAHKLAVNCLASSMIDISDGIFRDLDHICKMSNTGASIDLRKLPGIEKVTKVADIIKLDRNKVISGGEDFELLFTVDKNNLERLKHIILDYPDHDIKEIGKILDISEGFKYHDMYGKLNQMEPIGFEHF